MATAAPRVIETPTLDAAFADGVEHMVAELERIALLLHVEVLRLRAAKVLNEDPFRGLYIADEQIDAILAGTTGPRMPAGGNTACDLELVLQRLEGIDRQIAVRCEASRMAGITLPLARLALLYGLTVLERDALLLSVAPELDGRFETLIAYAHNDVTRKHATVGLVLRILSGGAPERLALRTLFSADGRLLRTPLVRLSEEAQDRDRLLARAVIPEQRIVGFLLGQNGMDHRLRAHTRVERPSRSLDSLHMGHSLCDALCMAERTLRSSEGVMFLQGPRGAGKQAAAAALSAVAGRELLVADLRQVDCSDSALAFTLSLLRREAMLRGANILLLDRTERCLSTFSRRLGESVKGSGIVYFVAGETAWPVADIDLACAWSAFEFPLPGYRERHGLWGDALAEQRVRLGSMAAELANQFVLTGGQIRAACRLASMRAAMRGVPAAGLTKEHFEAAARSLSNQGLQRRAQKITSTHGWNDLVLPPRVLQQLKEVCAAERYRSVVFAEWGFDKRQMQGKGLNVLFSGPSGTGKTMSAGIVGRELGLDLYKIDLSSVVSKYIGETEKQLSEVFREAQSSNAILFFDEADAIFGKRSEVKDAHDRYANVEVAYLLQKMEEYEGIVILATNFRKNIDDAFTRRIQYIVEFPFPDAQNRERLWRGVVPHGAPLEPDVDFGFLARQFDLTGGNIRNAMLVAAFLAAEAGGSIRMEHLVLATSRELQKMGRLPSRSEFREYYELTRDRG